MGYAPGQREHLFFGEVTGVQADFPATGVPTITLVAHDFMQRLTQGKITRGFSILPDFVIAAIMSVENLLLPMIDPVVIAASTATGVLNAIFKGSGRKQRGQTDLDLMKEIADLYDADFWVGDPPFEADGLRGRTLYLSRILFKEYEPRLTMTWGESLLSFTPRVSKIGQVVGVAIRFTLPLIPISFVTVVAWDFDRESLSVSMFPGLRGEDPQHRRRRDVDDRAHGQQPGRHHEQRADDHPNAAPRSTTASPDLAPPSATRASAPEPSSGSTAWARASAAPIG